MGDHVESLLEDKVDNIHCSLLIYQARHFITEGYRVHQAWIPLCESIMISANHFFAIMCLVSRSSWSIIFTGTKGKLTGLCNKPPRSNRQFTTNLQQWCKSSIDLGVTAFLLTSSGEGAEGTARTVLIKIFLLLLCIYWARLNSLPGKSLVTLAAIVSANTGQ